MTDIAFVRNVGPPWFSFGRRQRKYNRNLIKKQPCSDTGNDRDQRFRMADAHRNEERHPDTNHDADTKCPQHMVAVKPSLELLKKLGTARLSQKEENLAWIREFKGAWIGEVDETEHRRAQVGCWQSVRRRQASDPARFRDKKWAPRQHRPDGCSLS